MFCSLALMLAADPAAALPPLPEAVSSFGAVALDGHVYTYGGHAGRTHTYSTETTSGKLRRLNLANPGKGWEDLAGGPHLQGLALVAHKGRVYRIGGMRPRNAPGENADNHSVATVARFDPVANRWEQLADLPAPRSSHDAAVVGDTLVVVGGWQMKGAEKPTWHTEALTLDLADPKADWKPASQPFSRRALTCAVHDGKVFVVAGLTAAGKTDPQVNVFDPATRTWAAGPAIPNADKMNAFTPAAVVAGGNLYVSPADGTVYKLAGTAWEPAGKLAQPRFVHRVVAANGKLIVLGGASKAENVAAVETLEAK